MEPKGLKLPPSVIGKAEIAKLLRELNNLDDFFVSAANRKSGSSITPPRVTRMLEETARQNSVNLLEEAHRKKLEASLAELNKNAPALNISFAAEPTPKAFEQILLWFRQNIHPQTLLQIGLQPSIAAGCVLRTPNKVFDMSLSARLKDQSEYLSKLIDGAVNG